MSPFFVALLVIASFSGGMVTMHFIWRERMKSTERLQRMLTNARRQGQVERDNSKSKGLEPPTWLP